MPAIVTMPSTKSVGDEGAGNGLQRNWFGVVGSALKSLTRSPASMRSKGLCIADGRMRYSQERRFVPRSAVKAVPVSCSA